MGTSVRRLTHELLRALAVAALVAVGLVLVPGGAGPANAVNYCGIKSGYMCVYLTLTGNGSGNATFQSYAFNGGSTVTVNDAPCVRQGGSSSGTCLLTLSSTTATSVTVTAYLASLGGSCYRYNGGGCTGSGGPVSPSFSWVNGSVGINVAYELLNPESMTVARSGTGSGSVVSSPRGISCPGTCTADFASGTSVQLTATADAGTTFGGFSSVTPCAGPGPGSSTCTWVMNSPVDVTAIFNGPTSAPPTPTPTPRATATPKPTPHATATAGPHPSVTTTNGPTARPTSVPAGTAVTSAPGSTAAPAGPSAEASPPATVEESSAASASASAAAASLAPLDTPPPDLTTTSGPGGFPIVVIGVAAGLLAIGGFLLFRGLRRA